MPSDFTAEILKPYRENATYLKAAEITAGQRQDGDRRHRPEADHRQGPLLDPRELLHRLTGHFNAVEFNICYNQLAYVLFAGCIDAGVMGKVRAVEGAGIPTVAEFKHDQLPAMMIVALESRYFKPLDSKDFTAELSISKISAVGNAWFFFTTITFSDAEGVKAKGVSDPGVSPAYNPSMVH